MRKNTSLKFLLALMIVSLSTTSTALAGGILTNTNLSARYVRLLALEASVNVDAAYHNPAGTVHLPEGLHFAVANQSILQERKITSSFFLPMPNDGSNDFIGKTSSLIVPSIQGVYKKERWALSGSFGVTGGGGKATFTDGLPFFESQLAIFPSRIGTFGQVLADGIPDAFLYSKGYSFDQYVQSQSYIFGFQLGAAYQINDMFSVYGGARFSLVNNKYEGLLTDLMLDVYTQGLESVGVPNYDGLMNPTPIFDVINNSDKIQEEWKDLLQLPFLIAGEGAYIDAKQSGWGIAPIVGFHFSHAGLNIGARYEFKSGFDVKNKTSDKDNIRMFPDGEKVNHDLPAFFSVGASYDILPCLTASVGYHHFFEKDAAMADAKQKFLSGNTNEYLAGIEYQINNIFLVSAGTQLTRFGMTDEFQSDLNFFLDSYSIGFGGAVKLSENAQLNAGYLFTNYSDYTKSSNNYNGTYTYGSDVYSRENQIFTIGVEFSF